MEQYRYAKAYEKVVEDFANFVVGLKNYGEDLAKKQNSQEQSIEEA